MALQALGVNFYSLFHSRAGYNLREHQRPAMSKSVDVPLSQLKFPSICVVCMAPATMKYELQKIFSYGRRSYTVKAHVPMCNQHFEAASFKGTFEKLVEFLGIIEGMGAGIVAIIILLIAWQPTPYDSIFLKIFAGSIVGFGAFIIIWALIALWLAPMFAEPASKEARKAVQITNYWPRDQFVRLEFKHEPLAEIVEKAL